MDASYTDVIRTKFALVVIVESSLGTSQSRIGTGTKESKGNKGELHGDAKVCESCRLSKKEGQHFFL